MTEQELDIVTPDGKMNTFITYPDEGGPFPVALFLMDAMGKRNELHDLARRLAGAGYYVLLPNLYYCRIREYIPDWSDEEKRWRSCLAI
jgi:carboxymethylenebutenolidase